MRVAYGWPKVYVNSQLTCDGPGDDGSTGSDLTGVVTILDLDAFSVVVVGQALHLWSGGQVRSIDSTPVATDKHLSNVPICSIVYKFGGMGWPAS